MVNRPRAGPLSAAFALLCASAYAPHQPARSSAGGSSPAAFVVSGSVRNVRGTSLRGARPIIVWFIDDDRGDAERIYGEGSLSRDGRRFRIELPEDLPGLFMLTAGAPHGIGMILLTNDSTLGHGGAAPDWGSGGIIGLAGRNAVVYVSGELGEVGRDVPWLTSFPRGYSLGAGPVIIPGEPFQGFAPTHPDSAVLTVDELRNIPTVNWTSRGHRTDVGGAVRVGSPGMGGS